MDPGIHHDKTFLNRFFDHYPADTIELDSGYDNGTTTTGGPGNH
jgi:hypothetical protein